MVFVDVRDAGTVAAQVLAEPEPHLGRAYTLTGTQAVTFEEVAEILTEELGCPVRHDTASVAGYLRHLRRRGLSWGQALVYARLHVGLRWGEGSRTTPELERLLGRPAFNLRDYIRDHRALWL